MRTTITTLALALCLGVSAQSASSVESRRAAADAKAAERTTELTAELGLSTEQTAKLTEAHQQYYRNLAELQTIPEKDRAGRERALNDNRSNAMAQILTADQFKKWSTLKK